MVQRKHVLPEDVAAAQKELQGEFPKLTFISKLGDGDDAFWERFMRKGEAPLSLAGLIRSILDPFLEKAEKLGVITVDLTSDGAGEEKDLASKGIRVNIDGKEPPSGKDPRPFGLNHVYRRKGSQLVAHIEQAVAPNRGRELFHNSLLPLFDSLGVSRISLRASASGGSNEGVFAWARYGFVPRQEDWDRMREEGRDLPSSRMKKLGPAGNSLRKIWEDDAPVAMRRMVYLAWEHRGEVQAVVNKVMGWPWNGELDLTDEASRTWIEKYTNREDWKTFRDLLPEEPVTEPSTQRQTCTLT